MTYFLRNVYRISIVKCKLVNNRIVGNKGQPTSEGPFPTHRHAGIADKHTSQQPWGDRRAHNGKVWVSLIQAKIFNNIRCHVFWQCMFNFWEGFVVNGVINVVLVALEKRYSLTSSRSGSIASSNDFGAVICCVLVGYFGEQRHKPRIIGTGILLMAIGCFVFSLPHFIGGEYEFSVSSDNNLNDTGNMCYLSNTTDRCHHTAGIKIGGDYTVYYVLLLLGNILLGIGASPMFTIGLSYIDENCRRKNSSFYISWTFCSAAIGVAIGYVVGGQTLRLFVDVDKIVDSSIPLTMADPQWVGAWWIGPLIALLGFIVVVTPICGYPKRLPNYDELQKVRESEAHGGDDELAAQVNFGKSWKDFPKSVFLLIKNPTYDFICLGAAMEALIIGGTATFGAKLMQEKFNIDLTMAGTIMGIITIPGSGGGMLLGGYLVKRYNLKCRGILRMCSAFMLTALCFGPFLLAHCQNDAIAGINEPYHSEPLAGLSAGCNDNCGCSTQGFEPVCVDNLVYFTPCHAGCKSADTIDGHKQYNNCTCLESGQSGNSTAHYDAISGLCAERCIWLYVFATLFLVVMILTFATMSPGVAALFRCVPDKQRSIGIGVNLLFVRLVGTMPGPILLGLIIDSTCEVWQDNCGVQGSCWVYDKSTMSVRLLIWFLGLKFLGFTFFLIASFVYKPPPTQDGAAVHVSDIGAPYILPSPDRTGIQNTNKTFTRL